MDPYDVDESAGFQRLLKKVMKKYKHSFEDDFKTALQVICKKLALSGGKASWIPQTQQISGLGKDVEHPFYKTRIYIEEAGGKIGRLVYLVDTERKLIFLADVYHKSKRENHDVNLIYQAYNEFIEKYEEQEDEEET